MIIISLSQDLEGNPNLVVIDCINHLAIFFCQPTGKIPALAKASHHPSKASSIWQTLPMGKNSMEIRCVKSITHMFEGGNLLLNVTNIP